MPDETQLQDAPAVEGSGTQPANDTPEQPPTGATEDASAPAVPEPEPEPQQDEAAQLRAELAAIREERALLMEAIKQQRQPEAPKPQAEPDIDIGKIVAENFAGEPAAAIAKVTAALEAKFAKKYAPRDEVQHVQQTTVQMAVDAQLRETGSQFEGKGVPAADVAAAQKMIREDMAKYPGQQLWRSAEAAFQEKLGLITLERQYAKADTLQAKKNNVMARQQKQVAPVNTAPAGTGKVEFNPKELRKKAGRKLTTQELLDAMAKTGA